MDRGYRESERISSESGFDIDYIETDLCPITVYHRISAPLAPLNVYLEGDGLAWKTRFRLSDDPTPRSCLVLSLASVDPSVNVAYIARPGQLTKKRRPDCSADYWSEKRFSREVIDAINTAVDVLKSKTRASGINLIAYSGGAAVAVVIAAERDDVMSLRTIAGNLDHYAVNTHNNVSPLAGSLDPMCFAEAVEDIPQRHFIGSEDDVIPACVVQCFAKKRGDTDMDSVTIVEGATHTKGWLERWKELLSMPLK
jgi:hypothetical protein